MKQHSCSTGSTALGRRAFLQSAGATAASVCFAQLSNSPWAHAADKSAPYRVATFYCNITPPLGQPMIGCDRIGMVEHPMLAKGIVMEADGQRYVLCALDWCEINNGAYDNYRSRIAVAAGTTPAHVALQTVHQHTAPVVDIDARKLLDEMGVGYLQLHPLAFEAIGQRLAHAVQDAAGRLTPFDRIGCGQAKVDRVASSRRIKDAEGKVRPRMSCCNVPEIRDLPEGKIDPYLKTITLAHGDKPLVRLHYYATHPQTRYRDGRATSDMVGDAREAWQQKEGVFQIYFNGCGGDITLGKYNDGSPRSRAELAGRLQAGMEAAIAATEFAPMQPVQWKTYPLVLPRRTEPDFNLDDCLARMKDAKWIAQTCKSLPTRVVMNERRIVFQRRSDMPIELTALRIGKLHVVHLPGEPMIDYQFYAQSLHPEDFVAVAGYGDAGLGYFCTAQAFAEGGYEPTASNIKPESEALLKKAIAALLEAR